MLSFGQAGVAIMKGTQAKLPLYGQIGADPEHHMSLATCKQRVSTLALGLAAPGNLSEWAEIHRKTCEANNKGNNRSEAYLRHVIGCIYKGRRGAEGDRAVQELPSRKQAFELWNVKQDWTETPEHG